MALDHYVSQVHLRNFYSPADELMHAVRKSDLKEFRCNSKSVCRIEKGSTNAYLNEQRAIEEFLRNIEPKYNASVAKIAEGRPDYEAILAIAGFVAYVGTCSPAAMRLQCEPLRNLIRTTAELLDRDGLLPMAPQSLGGKSISELFASGEVVATIDPKFPQAIGISSIVGLTSLFANAHWEVLLNDNSGSPFFTSDYPLALEAVPRSRVPNWLVPLTPTVALRVTPDPALSGRSPDLTFSNFSLRRRNLSHQDARKVNLAIVRCAEELVFYREALPWIPGFVSKNRAFRVEVSTDRVPTWTGVANISRQRIVERPSATFST